MIRKKILVALLCLSAVAGAQTVTKAGVATQFNQWRVQGTTNLAVGANPQVPISPCSVTAGGANFNALAASTPIKIYNPNNPAIDEVVTPTNIVVGSTCTATLTVTNAHATPWNIGSGTQGLQEAINATVATGVLNTVILDQAWFAAGGTAKTVNLAVGSPYISILATSITPYPTYRWNGTAYVPSYSLLNVSAPTIAAGAAAGSSPTVSTAAGSSGNIMTANVTTGTATTTGTLFTETVGTAAVGGNLNCTVQSVGVNTPPAFTVTMSSTVVTVAVAVAPTVSTAYVFGLACN